MKKNILLILIITTQSISPSNSQNFLDQENDFEFEFIGNGQDTPYVAKDPAETTAREEEDMFYNEGEDQDD